jgi:hypothetical protein
MVEREVVLDLSTFTSSVLFATAPKESIISTKIIIFFSGERFLGKIV